MTEWQRPFRKRKSRHRHITSLHNIDIKTNTPSGPSVSMQSSSWRGVWLSSSSNRYLRISDVCLSIWSAVGAIVISKQPGCSTAPLFVNCGGVTVDFRFTSRDAFPARAWRWKVKWSAGRRQNRNEGGNEEEENAEETKEENQRRKPERLKRGRGHGTRDKARLNLRQLKTKTSSKLFDVL